MTGAPQRAGELRAVASMLDQLDYYELLELERGASGEAVRRAYHRASRRFHPDAWRQAPDELRVASARVAARLSEAYAVLRDPGRRAAYDRQLERDPRALRLGIGQAGAAARSASAERSGRTGRGRRFFEAARRDLRRGDRAAALRNLQMALAFEPGNPHFEGALAALREGREVPELERD